MSCHSDNDPHESFQNTRCFQRYIKFSRLSQIAFYVPGACGIIFGMCLKGGGRVQGIGAVPQQRIREKLDEYMSRRDYDGVTRHLNYWLEEARAAGDLRGELMIRNEFVGHCRKIADREGALTHIGAALALLDRLELDGTVIEGTTCVNAATTLNAFGENERALALFQRARAAYGSGEVDPGLLGGLYNNMALTCASLGQIGRAHV